MVALCFTPSGRHLFVCRLLGQVTTYRVKTTGDGDLEFDGPHELHGFDINTGGLSEFGLTGLVVPHGFDERSKGGTPCFFPVTTVRPSDGESKELGIARVDRVMLQESEQGLLTVVSGSVKAIRVWEHEDIRANAHNLHGGSTVRIGDRDFLLLSFGDLNKASKYCQNAAVDFGKLLIMDYDGSPPDRAHFDSGYENAGHLAYGNRNMFEMRQFSPSTDSRERFVWGENGNSVQRCCVYSLLEPGRKHDLGWSTGGDTSKWNNLVDPATRSDAVLFSGPDSSGIVIEPFLGSEAVFGDKLLPAPPANTSLLLHSYMNGSEDPNRSRGIFLESIANLGNAPQPAGFLSLKKLVWTDNEFASAPLSIAIHRPTGTFVFGDIFTGNIVHVKFVTPVNVDLGQPSAKERDCRCTWAVPTVIALSIIIVGLIIAVILLATRRAKQPSV